MDITRHAHTLAAADGERLHCEDWLPAAAAPGAGLLLVHGVGEHSGRYDALRQQLAGGGLAVFSWDQRGHGRSTGPRGHVASWAHYRADLLLRFQQARRTLPAGAPLFLMGHSMGSLVALDTVLQRELEEDISGLIVLGAPIQPVGVARPHLILLARALSRLWPTFRVRLPLRAAQLTGDPAQQATLRADPLAHPWVTVRWGTESLRALRRVRENASALRHPLLVMHGALDTVNAREGAEQLYHAAASPDKTLLIYPGSRHEPHNDIERETVLRDLAAWLAARA